MTPQVECPYAAEQSPPLHAVCGRAGGEGGRERVGEKEKKTSVEFDEK